MPARNNKQHSFSLIIGISVFFIALIVVGVAFYSTVEGLRLIDAIYLTSMTLMTVGFGDIVPVTDVGKIFTSVYAFLGVVTFLGFAAALFEAVLSRFKK